MLSREVGELVRRHWSRFGFTPPVPRHLEVVKASSGLGSSKAMLFVFADGSAYPAAVAKVARDAGAAARMRRAHDLLARLRPALPESVRRGLARPLLYQRVEDAEVAIEAYLPGRTMYRIYPRRPWRWQRARIERDFDLACSWLCRFHLATRAQARVGMERVRQHWRVAVDLVREYHALSPAEVAALNEVALGLPQDDAARPPLVCQQGDYWPRNVLLTHAGMAVCDWEWMETQELPFLDVFLFPLSYALTLGPPGAAVGSWMENWRLALGGSGWLAHLSRDFVFAYLQALGIDGRLAPAFFLMMLLHMAVRDCRATGRPSRNDLQYRHLLGRCVRDDLLGRGWLANLGASLVPVERAA